MRARLAAALAGALALTACTTAKPVAYGPIGGEVQFGYKDRPNPGGGHTLLVVMPPYVPPAEAQAYWDRRAAELCPAGEAKRILFRAERKEFTQPAMYVQGGASTSTRVVTAYELEGYLYCKGEAVPAG